MWVEVGGEEEIDVADDDTGEVPELSFGVSGLENELLAELDSITGRIMMAIGQISFRGWIFFFRGEEDFHIDGQ